MLLAAFFGPLARTQTIGPAISPYAGSVTTAHLTAATLPLSLEDAVRRGLEHNLAVVLARQQQDAASGRQLQALNPLMPNIDAQATRARQQINIEALGFRPGLLAQLPPGFFPVGPAFNPIITVELVSAQANLQQALFNASAFEEHRAARDGQSAAEYDALSTRDLAILTVASSYLEVLADAANVDNARSLLQADTVLLQQVKDAHQAGTATHLDQLRAQVLYEEQQQALIAAQNALDKAKITLERQIGLPAGQPIQLTDTTPYADLEEMGLAGALQTAYAQRPDYKSMQAQVRAAEHQYKAARMERLPSLSFQGNYGVTGTVGSVYHGTFLAAGNLSVPLFREASLRGDRDVAQAGLQRAQSQLADLHEKIGAQVRDSLLDIAATRHLVDVARSNVALAEQSLRDTTDRFQNGVDDTLPVVEAQAALAAAQAQLVNSLYQFNRSKLQLASDLGVLEQQYRAYLGQ